MSYTIEKSEQRLFAGDVADEIVYRLNDAISARGKATIVLSGGSTPAVVFRALATPPRVGEVDWSKVIFLWGDERWVGKDDQQSNYGMANLQLLQYIKKSTPEEIHIDTSLNNPEEAALDCENRVRKIFNLQNKDIPVFDIVLLGLGDDGHTASLFPGNDNDTSDNRIYRSVVSPIDGTKRITITPEVIINARQTIFIVTGAKKADIVNKILMDSNCNLPATIFRRAKGHVTWFLDSAAASKV